MNMAGEVKVVLSHSSTHPYECGADVFVDGKFDKRIEAKDRFELSEKIKRFLDATVW